MGFSQWWNVDNDSADGQ